MANPIIKIKRGTNAPTTGQLQAGEFAIDQAAKNLYLGIDDGNGNITNEVVGGEGTFATKAYVATALGGVSGTLGDMAQQYKNAVNITGGSLNNTENPLSISGADLSSCTLSGTINANAAIISSATLQSSTISGATIDGTSIGATTPSTGAFTSLTVANAPAANNDAVRKTDLDTAISALGAVFHYVGNVSLATTPFDLSTLPDQSTGAYYRVDVAGTYVDPGYPNVEAQVGDAFVLSVATGFQKLDNVDAVVLHTPNEIAVTGDENVGYTVSIDPVFSGRVSDVEDKTQHVTATAATIGPASGSTSIVGGFEVGAPLGGSMIKVAPTSLDLELNLLGNSSVKSHATLELVDSSWGLPTGAGGGYSIKADGRIMTSAGGLDVTGDSTLTGNLSVTGTVGGTNITDLETKTQNIDLAGTTAGTTKVNGKFEISHGGFNTVFDTSYGTTTNAPIAVTHPTGISADRIESFNGGLTLSGAGGAVTISSATSLSGSGSTALEGFVIDGGVY